jgi:hypothetical protein
MGRERLLLSFGLLTLFSLLSLALFASWDDAMVSRGGNVVGYDIRRGIVTSFSYAEGVISRACCCHVFST